MTDELVYFGRPGNLTAITQPKDGVTSGRVRQVDVFQLGSGGMRISKTLGGQRRYTLRYGGLDYATFAALESYDQGHQGPGPFVLLDPARRNMLTVNQSGATSETNGVDNISVAGSGGTITSDASTYLRGPRSLKWSFSVTNPSSAVVSLDPPTADWPGFPVAIRPYVFSFYARGGGTDPTITLTAKMTWVDVNGISGTVVSGTPVVTSSGGWVQATVSGTPPAGTAFVNYSVAASGASVTSGGVVYLDQFNAHEGSTPDATWTPGTGVLPVQVVSLDEGWTWALPGFRDKPVLVLQEVGVGR